MGWRILTSGLQSFMAAKFIFHIAVAPSPAKAPARRDGQALSRRGCAP
ncbi:MAG: hypothetical protein AAFQ79_17040 [Pseudomonadota bacterium]